MKLTYLPVRGELSLLRSATSLTANRHSSFILPGRAEPILLMLQDSGIQFEQEIISSEVSSTLQDRSSTEMLTCGAARRIGLS